jgi:hypothetical protein
MKPVRRRQRSQSNGYAGIEFPFFFNCLARWRRHNAPLEESDLSARRDAQSATGQANDLESLFFPVIFARRRRVVIRRQYVRRKVSFAAHPDAAEEILT